MDCSPHPDEAALRAIASDESASPTVRRDAIHTLGQQAMTAPTVHALADLLDGVGPVASQLLPRLVEALTAAGTQHPVAADALLRRAQRRDRDGVRAAESVSDLLHHGALRDRRPEACDWARAVLDHVPTGAETGWWDAQVAAALRAVRALAMSPPPHQTAEEARAEVRPLADPVAWWLTHRFSRDRTDTTTIPTLQALEELGPLDGTARDTVLALALGEATSGSRPPTPWTRARAVATVLRSLRPDELPEMALLEAIEQHLQDPRGQEGLRDVPHALPALPSEEARELALLAIAAASPELLDMAVLAACAHPQHLPPGLLLPLVEDLLQGRPDQRLSAVEPLARLAFAHVPGAEALLNSARRDRSQRVVAAADQWLGRLSEWRSQL